MSRFLTSALFLSLMLSGSLAKADVRAELYNERNFNSYVQGDIHISAFVFRDVEGDGKYRDRDRPMVDVYVGLRDESGKTIYEKSNIDGFVNFTASTLMEGADITSPGNYKFEILPPPGWRLTTDNAVQEIEVEGMIGSPGGLVAKSLPTLMGLAKEKSIVSGSGDLSFREGDQFTRIGFDDVIQSIAVKKLQNGYNGLNWENWVVTHQRFYKGEGYINGTVSGEFVAYNGSGHPMSVSRDRPFDFIGGYLTSAWRDAEGETVQVTAWRGDEIAYQDEVKLSRFGPVYFKANYDRVTKVELKAAHFWQVVADDLLFNLD